MIDVEKAVAELEEEMRCVSRVMRSSPADSIRFYSGYEDGLRYAVAVLRDLARKTRADGSQCAPDAQDAPERLG